MDFKKKLEDLRAEKARAALDKKLSKVKGDAAPNMNPNFKPKKEVEKEPPPPAIGQFDIPTEVRMRIIELTDEITTITVEQGRLKKKKALAVDQIKPLCKLYTLDKYSTGTGSRGVYYPQEKTTIDKDLLLAKGVSPEIIAACTITTKTWAFKAGVSNGQEEED